MSNTPNSAAPHTDFAPLLIGERFIILPPATAADNDGRLPIKMARGAFGSGAHETTQSCLEALETLNFPRPPQILDLGSGTGILTIAAVKLFGGNAWCVDIDPIAVASARHHCLLNEVAAVSHHCGPLETLAAGGFDLILANIYGDILLAVAEDLVRRATPGAIILLSGILWEYNYDIRHRYQELGCTLLKNRLLDDFSTILLKKA